MNEIIDMHTATLLFTGWAGTYLAIAFAATIHPDPDVRRDAREVMRMLRLWWWPRQ